MRIIVTGSRYWTNEAAIHDRLVSAYRIREHLIVVHGACQDRNGVMIGVDRIAHNWALAAAGLGLAVEVEPHPANWRKYGNTAGPIRNAEMVNLGVWCGRCRAEGFVAAWPLGISRGTRGCMDMAGDAGLQVENFGDELMRRL